MSTKLLEVEHLSKRFALGGGGLLRRRKVSQVHAVDDVSLCIGRGEILGLVGESGCGKSTLVRMLARLLDPTEGAIWFDRTAIGEIPARRFGGSTLRGKIQMVFQDAEASINPRHTAFDAIALPLRRILGLSGAGLRSRVESAATRCGLPVALLGRFPHQLSGGQKARVGIARAVACEPALLILDEPTAALDVSVQVVILELLAALKAELGMSYLFVSHDLNLVRLLCDRVVVMYLGRVVEQGPAEAVFATPAHPYTRALVNAVSVPGKRAGAAKLRLTGEPRSPIDPDPNACRFLGRCPQGQDRCGQAMPPLAETAPGRVAACHFATVA